MHIVIYVQINEYTYMCVVYQLHAQGGNHYIIIKKITVTIFHNFWWFWWWLVIIYIILCFLWILMIFKDFSQFFWQILFWQCTLRGAILTCWLLITYRYICGEKNLSPCPYAYHIYIYLYIYIWGKYIYMWSIQIIFSSIKWFQKLYHKKKTIQLKEYRLPELHKTEMCAYQNLYINFTPPEIGKNIFFETCEIHENLYFGTFILVGKWLQTVLKE